MKTIIKKALKVMESEFKEGREQFSSSNLVKDYCRLQIGAEKEEIFSIMLLDARNRLLSFEKLFHGTINEAKIHPRAIVRLIIEYNAAKVILCHNHPSGDTTPSIEDKEITKILIDLLRQIDCEAIDHIIVSSIGTFSFAENNLL